MICFIKDLPIEIRKGNLSGIYMEFKRESEFTDQTYAFFLELFLSFEFIRTNI